MVEFGNESIMIIESSEVPMCIWIQLTVTILILVTTLFLLAFFTIDQSTTTPDAVNSPSSGGAAFSPLHPSSSNSTAKAEHARVQRKVETSDGYNNECGSSSYCKDSRFRHPCEFFGLVKLAFLKCLGIDSTSGRVDQHEKKG